jgi:hypothetical protein
MSGHRKWSEVKAQKTQKGLQGLSDRFGNRWEVASKIDWEGGITEVLDYGVTAEDMPEGDTELAGAWHELDLLWAPLQRQITIVFSMLDSEED